MDEHMVIKHESWSQAVFASRAAEDDFRERLNRYGLDVMPDARKKWWPLANIDSAQ